MIHYYRIIIFYRMFYLLCLSFLPFSLSPFLLEVFTIFSFLCNLFILSILLSPLLFFFIVCDVLSIPISFPVPAPAPLMQNWMDQSDDNPRPSITHTHKHIQTLSHTHTHIYTHTHKIQTPTHTNTLTYPPTPIHTTSYVHIPIQIQFSIVFDLLAISILIRCSIRTYKNHYTHIHKHTHTAHGQFKQNFPPYVISSSTAESLIRLDQIKCLSSGTVPYCTSSLYCLGVVYTDTGHESAFHGDARVKNYF